MPKYTQPRKTWMYTNAFKKKAVKLSFQDGIKVKQVAEALDIHPFMLSRWRKEYRDGKLPGDIGRRVSVTSKKKAQHRSNLATMSAYKKRMPN